jgi:CHAT domain-containing protein
VVLAFVESLHHETDNHVPAKWAPSVGESGGSTYASAGPPPVTPSACGLVLAVAPIRHGQHCVALEGRRHWFAVVNFQAKGTESKFGAAHYAAWLIPPAGKGEIQIIDLGEAEPIDQAVLTARQAIQATGKAPEDRGLGGVVVSAKGALQPHPAEADETALGALTKLIFEPLRAKLGSAKCLIISPDASLWLVPWAALPLANGKYAIEEYQIRYTISGRDLISQSGDNSQPTPSVVFANPDFDLPSTKIAAATESVLRSVPRVNELVTREISNSTGGIFPVPRLPGTATEAEAIRPQLNRYGRAEPQVYLDQYALEGVFKTIKKPNVLVLSTHGFYLPDQELKRDENRALITSANQQRELALTADGKPVENPLLRCGLLLAGCNGRANAARVIEDIAVDDGILTGVEIVGTDLRGTELVVLSACETGVGQLRNGEGVAGLRQAFQLAGAKSVLATLWQIPDQSTVEIISAFFNNLATGQSKAEALRNAQLAAIKARRAAGKVAAPYFWAAFTITGG